MKIPGGSCLGTATLYKTEFQARDRELDRKPPPVPPSALKSGDKVMEGPQAEGLRFGFSWIRQLGGPVARPTLPSIQLSNKKMISQIRKQSVQASATVQ